MLGPSSRPRLHLLWLTCLVAPLGAPAVARAQTGGAADSGTPAAERSRPPGAPDTTPDDSAPADPPAPPPAGARPSPDDDEGGTQHPAQPTTPRRGAAPGAARSGGRPNLLPTRATGAEAEPASAATVDPKKDAEKLAEVGKERATLDGTVGERPSDVYSDDWWTHTRPTLELHGYFRTRGEVYHNLFLGRHNAPGLDAHNLAPQPLDHTYGDTSGVERAVLLCGPASSPPQRCYDKTQAHANMRLRIEPEIHISDNLRILSQIDALDNLVLGSTPDSYAMQPSSRTPVGYAAAGSGYSAYAPTAAFSTTQDPPTAGVNGYRNSVDVKRAWAEYATPIGQVRFGRMPHHWGLGMLWNSGNYLDADWQSTIDRIQIVSGIKPLDMYFGGSWDFVGSGPTTATPYSVSGGQPYNTGNLVNVNQWSAFFARRKNPELQRLALSRGEVVLNGGLYTIYRAQDLDIADGTTPTSIDTSTTNNGLVRRDAQVFIPDLWVQVLWQKFRFEGEFATLYGSIGSTPQNANVADPVKIRQFGLATQSEYRAVEDKLRLQFGFGWGSGNDWEESLAPSSHGIPPLLNGGRGPLSTFRFNPAYLVDQIFFRRIMTRVQGAYYFRPSVEYDFMRKPNGQKFGGGAAIIWSRASEFMQTPGNKRDLGVELDLSVYYQAKDGTLNDDPNIQGGFFTMLQYGVFFPLGGLSYLPGEQTTALPNWETSSAQVIRLFLGVRY